MAKAHREATEIKSANPLGDALGPDFNDYGFVSPETNDLYRKYMEKATLPSVRVTPTKARAKSRPGMESNGERAYRTSKTLYDPDEERKLREAATAKPKSKQTPQAAPMDFQALLRLAEKNQQEPIKVSTPPKKQPQGRLRTAREKMELEARAQRQRDRKRQSKESQKENMASGKDMKSKETESTSKPNADSALLQAAAARRAFNPDGSVNKLALELKAADKGHSSKATDSDYDSDLDGFIDDSECQENISSYIRNIFGYDRRRYCGQDNDDDCMESSFAQVQHEELVSKRLGAQEDLEEMRMEVLHKKMKMAKLYKK